MNETKKMKKIKKNAYFGQIGKITVQLNDEYYKNGKTAKI